LFVDPGEIGFPRKSSEIVYRSSRCGVFENAKKPVSRIYYGLLTIVSEYEQDTYSCNLAFDDRERDEAPRCRG